MPEPVANVTVIQLTELVAVHVQLVPDTTESEPVLAVDGALALIGVTEYVQLLADWLTVTVCPATSIVPVRATPVLFTATV